MMLEILKTVEHNPHYLYRYLHFVTTCNERNTLLIPKIYDKHHICPKAKDMFPEFSNLREFPWNCAILTPREHLIAHKLLVRAYPNSLGVRLGLIMMVVGTTTNIRSLLQSTVVVRDNSGNCFRVSTDDYRYLIGELKHTTVGRVTAIDLDGTFKSVSIEDFRSNDNLRGVSYKTTTVKDTHNKYYRVSVTDPRIASGELVGVTKGKTTVVDKEGNYMSIDTSDLRLSTGEFTHINKGKVAVRDKNGNTFQTDIKDPRYLSGELVSANKGRKAPNLKLSDEVVLKLRELYKSKTTDFSTEFILEVVRESDKINVGVKPTDTLKSRNNRPLTHDLLFCMYYGKKYGLPTSRLKAAVEGSTYKHLS